MGSYADVHYRSGAQRKRSGLLKRRMPAALGTALFILLLLAAPALQAGAAHGAQVAESVAERTGTAAQGQLAAATPSPGDTASSGPANPGTGESGPAESTRLNLAPWIIGVVALLTLALVLIWRRRRNSTIV